LHDDEYALEVVTTSSQLEQPSAHAANAHRYTLTECAQKNYKFEALQFSYFSVIIEIKTMLECVAKPSLMAARPLNGSKRWYWSHFSPVVD